MIRQFKKSQRNTVHVCAGLALLFTMATAGAAESSRDGAQFEKLPQGPMLIMIPQRSVPMFSCTVLVPAGSALEDEKTSGAAHYLEHLLFNGTERRTREEIYAETDLLGAYNNASTQRERTVFQLLLPSEQWRQGLDLQSDMILHSTLPTRMFEKEKGILLEELAKDRSNVNYDANRFVAESLWGKTGRGLPVLGTETSIREMDPARVAEFYHTHYRAEGMTILLMGDFDVAEVRETISELYGTSTGSASIPPRPAFPEGRTIRSRPFEKLTSVRMQIQLPMPEIADDEYAGVRVLESLLNQGEHVALDSAFESLSITPLSVSAGVDAGAPWSLLTVSLDLPLDSFEDKTHSPESVTEVVLQHLASLLNPQSTFGGDFASAARELLIDEISLREKMHYYGLMRADVLGGAGPEATFRLLDDAPGAGDVALRLLRSALLDERLIVTVTGPSVPEGSRPAPAAPVVPTEDVAAPAHDTTALEVDFAQVDAASVTRTVLDNGLTLVVHASPDSRTFAAHLLLRDRSAVEIAGGVPRGTSDVIHRLMALGTENLSEAELRGRLSGLGAQLKVTDSAWIPYDDYYFSPEYSYVRLQTIDSYGIAALKLLAEVVGSPRITEESLASALESAATRATKDEGSSRSAASRAFFASGWDSHPLAGGVYGSDGDLSSLTLDQARAHHATMTDPARLTLVVSSDLDPNDVLEVVQASFAWTAPKRQDPLEIAPCSVRPFSRQHLEIHEDSEQAWIILGTPLLDVPEEDRPALQLAVAILSERLADRLRENEGLAYSIGAVGRLLGDGPAVMMTAGTRVENLERMEAGMLEVLAEFLAVPPTDEAVHAARNSREGRLRMRRLSRMGQAYAMAMADLRGLDPAALDAGLPALRAVNSDDVARVARRWLSFESPGVSIAQ